MRRRESTYNSANGLRANESDVLDEGRPRQCRRLLRVAADELDDVFRVAEGAQASRDSVDEPCRRPNDLFRALKHDGVTGKDGRENGAPCIVEGYEIAERAAQLESTSTHGNSRRQWQPPLRGVRSGLRRACMPS